MTTSSKVLIVEDETIVAKDIELKLKKMGHVAIGMVSSGEEAVEKALSLEPDLVLMDIKLRGKLDGIEAAAKIHAQSQIPLIYLTALSDEQTLQRAKVTEPFAYIQKPITTRELHIAVEIALYKHAIQKELSTQLQHMTAMRLIDQAIISGQDLTWTMNIILQQIAIQLDVDAVATMLVNRETGQLEYFLTYGFLETSLEALRRSGESDVAARMLQTKEINIIKNLHESPAPATFPGWMADEGFVLYIALPLMTHDRLLGVMEVFHRTSMEMEDEWFEFLITLTQQAAIAVEKIRLIDSLNTANEQILQSYDSTIAGLSAVLEMRDNITHGHSQRVTEMTVQIARAMGVPASQMDHLRRGAMLHDVGKMGVPDNILLKPGILTPEEWEVMRRHPAIANDMLSAVPFLQPALEIPLYHHERWDGSGYPYGLVGEQIPLAARIFAVADVWDALLTDRPYRRAWDTKKSLAFIQEHSGILFDPAVVEVFLNLWGNLEPQH